MAAVARTYASAARGLYRRGAAAAARLVVLGGRVDAGVYASTASRRGGLRASYGSSTRASASSSSASPSAVPATEEEGGGGVTFREMESYLHPRVTAALARLGLETATGIQSKAIPAVADGADVVIAAETGSGKTLSYLAPVWSNLLSSGAHPAGGGAGNGRLGALIMCPNATLCEQVARVADSLVDEAGAPLLRTTTLTPDTMLPNTLPDVVVATPARALEDVLAFSDGGWRRGNFAPAAVHIRHVVFDEADALLSGGYLRPVRGCFDVLYREEKLAALGLTAPSAGEEEDGPAGWEGDAERGAAAYERDWRKDHADVAGGSPRGGRRMGKGGPALGGKGEIGVGAGRTFRRQYLFAAATVMSNGKKTPGAMIKYGFPDATWVEGRRLHMAVDSVKQTWVQTTLSDRANALGRALALGSTDAGPGAGERTMVFVNSSGACEEVTAELLRQGLTAAAFHADVSTADRADRLADLAAGRTAVLVCTDAAARGVDVPGIAHVVQAEFAGNAVDYLHRIGRTARAGAAGRVTNLYVEGNVDLVEAVRAAQESGTPVEGAFSRKRSFRKKYKKYGPSRTAPQNRRR